MSDIGTTDPGDRRRARRVADLVHVVDLAIAGILLALCAWVYWLTAGFEEVAALFAQDVPPEFLPRLLLWTIVVLSLLLPFEHLLKPGGRAHFDDSRSKPIHAMAWATAVLLAVVVASIKAIGTFLAIVAVCVALPLLWGERRWKLILPYAVVFPLVVMLLFAKVLGVFFEPGFLGFDFR